MKNDLKNILLLGGDGFLGRNIVLGLSRKYNCFSASPRESIFCAGRRDAYFKKNPYRENIEGRYDLLVHLVDNKTELDEFSLQEKKLQDNITLNPNAHVIVFSSAAVYAHPESDYAQRKKRLEEIYVRYCKAEGFRLTIIRLFNTFGKFQLPSRQGSLVANIFYNYLQGKTIKINDPDASRDFIYAGDVASAVEEIIKSGRQGILDLGSGKLVSIRELLDLIQKEIIKKPASISYKNVIDRTPAIAAKKEISQLIVLTPIKKTLEQTFEFYKNNLYIIKKI